MILAVFAVFPFQARAADAEDSAPSTYALIQVEGRVELLGVGQVWIPVGTNAPPQPLGPGSELRTGPNGRATIRMSAQATERLGPNSYLKIPETRTDGFFQNLIEGVLYFFNRDKPGKFDIQTPRTAVVSRGTEFNVRVDPDGTVTLTMYDGEAELTNEFGHLRLVSGQEGRAPLGAKPDRTPAIATVDQIQWCLYYPGILHLDDLEVDDAMRQILASSFDAYLSGDLRAALNLYPENRNPVSGSEQIYLAALRLSIGDVEGAERLLMQARGDSGLSQRAGRLSAALGTLIRAVQFKSAAPPPEPQLATEWLALSYYHQSRSQLDSALTAARTAVRVVPRFGFAQARLAEMEFSFGRIDSARKHLNQSLAVAPRNAQSVALKGFLLAADNRMGAARDAFDQSIELDSALGNAWLGRGLSRIRLRDIKAGLEDLQVAVTLEPHRAQFRHYLGKAYSHAGDNLRALHEVGLGHALDPGDPTAGLYAALIKRQENRVNEAIGDLETSVANNDNRSLYRSRHLLDQDLAVRSANLAKVYGDAGMREVSVREAARSVNKDYTAYSGHLFLANSYSQLLDPGRVSLRFETAAVSEYLLANLLAPVGAGPLSPTISQQEYSKLFQSDGFGLTSFTEYLSRGAWLEEGAVYSTFGNSAFSLDGRYVTDNGQRTNNDLEQESLSALFRHQITPRDQMLFQVLWSESESGDVIPRYYSEPHPSGDGPNRSLRVEETQEPILLAGYQHEWNPEHRTLFLASYLNDTLDVTNAAQKSLFYRPPDLLPNTVSQDYQSKLEIYSIEPQHIMQAGDHTVIVGGRYQFGEFETQNRHPDFGGIFSGTYQSVDVDMERISTYLYEQWQIVDPLLLVAGFAYDHLTYPENHRFAPVSPGDDTTDQWSPKGGLIWEPTERATVRASYARLLGGVSFDQSFRLEPSQVAGLNQAFRGMIPNAVAGASAAESMETTGITIDYRFPTRTYLGLSGQWLWSDVDRDLGTYLDSGTPPFTPATIGESLDYEEPSLLVSVNQLIGDDWALGGAYRFSHADLEQSFNTGLAPRQQWESTLHHVTLFGILNHPSGFFGRGQAQWFQQSNHGYQPDVPGDEFWQFDVFGGWRFYQRRVEATIGVLNLADRDYRLSPLNLTPVLPRERTFMARLQFNF